ncbi:hypothetical protein GCM10010844_11600 [Deinococcus radiotolerans]|uniref:Uncharacterized protein n=1 Tax=Deinococcus radiotolerans TaxID=1309407 RepID=A0ABQ2FHE8_9DEIO|nr:hypothetical protein GCM10010844_11600 [Deinococcus radiotolerans]
MHQAGGTDHPATHTGSAACRPRLFWHQPERHGDASAPNRGTGRRGNLDRADIGATGPDSQSTPAQQRLNWNQFWPCTLTDSASAQEVSPEFTPGDLRHSHDGP